MNTLETLECGDYKCRRPATVIKAETVCLSVAEAQAKAARS